MDFTIIDAPFMCDEAPPKELKRFMDGKKEKFRSWLKFPKWDPKADGSLSPDCVYGSEEVTKFLVELLRD